MIQKIFLKRSLISFVERIKFKAIATPADDAEREWREEGDWTSHLSII